MGVGLGSQNIVNNFISGLIVILEQPVRAGDIVEVDGLTGEVERIGARATLIKSIDNTQIVVPNSSFFGKKCFKLDFIGFCCEKTGECWGYVWLPRQESGGIAFAGCK